MPAEENMAMARRFMEAISQGDLDALDDMLAPDFVSHNKLLRGQEPGRENFKRAVSAYRAAVSNPSIHFEDQVAGGDKVVTRPYNGHPRSGEPMGVALLAGGDQPGHRHPPHLRGQDLRGAGHGNTRRKTEGTASRAREDRARARRAGA